jgi:hypothetical protein
VRGVRDSPLPARTRSQRRLVCKASLSLRISTWPYPPVGHSHDLRRVSASCGSPSFTTFQRVVPGDA